MDPYAVWGATLLRIGLGIVYVMHGWLALAVIGSTETAGNIARLGYPAALSEIFAWYLIGAHLLGGLLLIVGLWTRPVASLQIPIMAAAALQFRWWQGFFLKSLIVDQTGRAVAGGYEYDLLVLIATCALALLGAGTLSVDEWRTRIRLELP